ncbi:uncharacterized protein LOC143022045 [Oratosquilla oratoria]|uniref:uncharacterized protein LOC143022045 n=1 Tax=Oratosquilla oratoria TaxID=337810 RepID=UPI003F76C711
MKDSSKHTGNWNHQFLKNCLEEQVCPKSFGFHKHRQLGHSFPAYLSEFMKERIKIVSLDCDSAFHRVRTATRNLKLLCPNVHTYNLLSRVALGKALHISKKHSEILNLKLTRLCNNSVWSKFSLTNNVINQSNVILTKFEQEVLGLGVSFALKPVKHHALDYIIGFDKFMTANEYDKDLQCLKGVLLQGIMDCFKDDNGLPKRYKQAVNNLLKHKNIIITRTDKGGKIVILNQSDYNTKALNLQADKETYEQLTKGPLKNTPAEFNKYARKIVGNDIFSKLKVIDPQLPNFYGLPKIHKEDILVIRNCDQLSFSVYRKPTHTGSYLHFFSHHPEKVKYSVASGLYLRALRLCSPQHLEEELEERIGHRTQEGRKPNFRMQPETRGKPPDTK